MSLRLLEPFTIKNMTLRNRIVMPPMCMYTCLLYTSDAADD